MATPQDKLAQSLSILKDLQDKGLVAIHTKNMTRTHRERLRKNGFIKEVMKGWYVPSKPDEPAGESTAWYASFWGFCADYLNTRFDNRWCLSAEQSLMIHSGDWTIPSQLIIKTPKGGNKPITLLHETSLMALRMALPNERDLEYKENLQIMSLSASLIFCAPSFYENHTADIQVALSMVSDASEILHKLLEGGHSSRAGRLTGAFRHIGKESIADDIINTMIAADYKVVEVNPFEEKRTFLFDTHIRSPYVNRIQMAWSKMREVVLDNFPAPSPLPIDPDKYLDDVEEKYTSDAYHSLSIEGYQVSAELIEKVCAGNWEPETNAKAKEHKDALAARGYFQAFQAVKRSLEKILNKEPAGDVMHSDHSAWYRELFAPSVTAGLIEATNLAGYRNAPVYIRMSKHIPPSYEVVRSDLMPAYFSLLKEENEPAVRAVLGHFFFVYIHPYIDGNGRMGRFAMNTMLASGGYPWTIVPVEKRKDYMTSLEQASVDKNIKPFTVFLADLVQKGIHGK